MQLTHSSEDEGNILRVGRLLGADWVVFVDTTIQVVNPANIGGTPTQRFFDNFGAAFGGMPASKRQALRAQAQLMQLVYHVSVAVRGFLFRLEAGLYPLAGQKAVEYGGGLHTKHRHIRYHDFFVARVKRGERILDIGCGNGALAHDIAERAGARVLGIDTNPENISGARQKFRHPDLEFRAGDALHHLPEGPFDVVMKSLGNSGIDSGKNSPLSSGRPFFTAASKDAAGEDKLVLKYFIRDWKLKWSLLN